MENRFTYADLKYLDELSMGDHGILVELVGLFLEQVPEYTEDLLLALMNQDYESLSRAAHQTKSSLAVLGMHSLAAEIEHLETLSGKHQNPGCYETIVNSFIEQTTLTSIELRDYLESEETATGVPQSNG